MKNLILFSVLLCWACAKPIDEEAEKAAITKLIDDETRYAAAADSANWSACWLNTDEAVFSIASADSSGHYKGWASVASAACEFEPFELNLKRDNYAYSIDRDIAFVTFDQQDNWGGVDRKTKESRTLKKVDGQWKIMNVSVVDISSYDKRKTSSFHIAKERIAVDRRTSFRNEHGLGGMAVAYVEVPAGTDFTPLFAGLPDNMCPAPHWGYMLEGSMKVKYLDGKEETINAGEVFYLPAPHTAGADKNAKFIDFSPEAEFTQLMDHIASKMAEQKTQ
jgi:hypothetical protein